MDGLTDAQNPLFHRILPKRGRRGRKGVVREREGRGIAAVGFNFAMKKRRSIMSFKRR